MEALDMKVLPGMKTPGRLYNFSAGPGTLPEEVLLEMKEELPLYRQAGASVLEISHRSPEYSEIAEQARAHLRALLGLGDEWHILFLQGGASLQFHQVPLNFLPEGGTADYLITGSWAKKAHKEAKMLGQARVAATSEDRNFSYIPAPDTWDLDPNAAYLHFTSNNTIFGTQFATEPQVDVPLVCDASSDFLSRPLDVDRYGLIYAGAQKNVGPAGVTVVLVRDDFLQRRNQPLPTMLDYGTHAEKLFNTPPVYAVYVVEKVLRWLRALGGLPAIAALNDAKAKKALRPHRPDGLLPGHGRAGIALEDERDVPAAVGRPGEAVRGRGERGRAAGAEGAPLRGRHPGLHLQRLPAGGRRRARFVHGQLRAKVRLNHLTHDARPEGGMRSPLRPFSFSFGRGVGRPSWDCMEELACVYKGRSFLHQIRGLWR
ncbi:MAG: hypothetical protein KatS3mg044_0139 [Rhodothermaceae bacterium]|nr:MAG: hypothetical protein KatS3mg044_0139 [Rhodothermaceae bacterium]